MLAEETLLSARILIVDDEPANVRVLERLLQHVGYANLRTTRDARDVLPLHAAFQPDLLLLDLMMPYLNGFQVMESLVPRIGAANYLPILVLTADINRETKRRALAAGARDFLAKPFDTTEVVLRIRNLLETRFLHLELQNQNQALEDRVIARTRDLEASQFEILERLARAAEYRDDQTGQHTQRVGRTTALLTRALGLPPDFADRVERAARLHDAGKIGIADAILLKPGRLSPEEFETMKSHTTIGARLLAGGHSELVRMAERIALTHHERWDGSGYPQGLSGEAIPIEGRILAVADVFDALTHKRPYKQAWPLADTVAEIVRESGRHFDPRLVAAFRTLPHETLL